MFCSAKRKVLEWKVFFGSRVRKNIKNILTKNIKKNNHECSTTLLSANWIRNGQFQCWFQSFDLSLVGLNVIIVDRRKSVDDKVNRKSPAAANVRKSRESSVKSYWWNSRCSETEPLCVKIIKLQSEGKTVDVRVKHCSLCVDLRVNCNELAQIFGVEQ